MDTDGLQTYLASLGTGDSYRVDALLKETPQETTQRVFFVGADGSSLGPFVRKLIRLDAGLGVGYEAVFAAQRAGVRLRYLPRILDCRRSGACLTVLMEDVPGVPLGERVQELGGPDARLRFAERVFPQVCHAVSELHQSLGVPLIHRDLKPGNILVGKDDGVMLIDLGISRLYQDGADCDTTHFGTRSYAPPEQFGFGQTSVRSDVYALGMLLFFCLAGREATVAEREAGFAASGLPGGLGAVVARATQLDPASRYESADALRHAFEDALPGDGKPPVPPAAAAVTAVASVAAAARRVVPAAVAARPRPRPRPRPRWLGALAVARNVVVWFAVALTISGSIVAFADPIESNRAYPTWFLALSFLLCVPAFVLALGFLLSGKTWLRAHVPALGRMSRRGEWALAGGVMAASMLLFVIGVMFLASPA